MPICAYCKKDRNLSRSHAIPDGFFRLISRRNNGKLVTIPRGSGNIHLGQNTGKFELLCEECEGAFNRRFDAPLVNAFKEWDRRITEKGFGVRFEFSANHMAQSLASVFWRAVVSENNMYAHAKVSPYDREQLLSIVQGDTDRTLELCSCSIKRLYDKRTPSEQGFSPEDFSQIILPVSAYRMSWGQRKPSRHFAFDVLMQGFLCHLIVPRLPFGKRNRPGFLNAKNKRLHAPKYYFADYKPLMDSLVAGVRKDRDGHSTLKD